MTDSKRPRHFLTLLDLSAEELQGLIDRAIELKAMLQAPARSTNR